MLDCNKYLIHIYQVGINAENEKALYTCCFNNGQLSATVTLPRSDLISKFFGGTWIHAVVWMNLILVSQVRLCARSNDTIQCKDCQQLHHWDQEYQSDIDPDGKNLSELSSPCDKLIPMATWLDNSTCKQKEQDWFFEDLWRGARRKDSCRRWTRVE